MNGRVILIVGLICLATNGVSAFSSGIFAAAPTMRNKAAISPFALRMQSSGDSDSASAKASMLSAAAAGPPNGVGASPEQRADMDAKLKALCQLNPTKEPAYALLRPPFQFFDGTYQLVYTDTQGGSSGKVGPFVGRVTQTFEGIRDLDQMGFSRRGIFLNAVEIGPLKVSLRARCESKSETKLEVVFEETETFILGQRVARKVEHPTSQRLLKFTPLGRMSHS
jgi:hypothetical protein